MKEQLMSDETMGQVIQIDEARIRDHLVRWFAGLMNMRLYQPQVMQTEAVA
jgi:hypothetical protein